MSKQKKSASSDTDPLHDDTNALTNLPTAMPKSNIELKQEREANSNHYRENLNLASNKSKRPTEDTIIPPMTDIKVSDIIGDFGPYQIAVVIFAALRAMSCAMDGLSGPFVSPNVRNFQCEVCDPSNNEVATFNTTNGTCGFYAINGKGTTLYELDKTKCYFSSSKVGWSDRISCNKWSFDNPDNSRLMTSLTIEQSLVCDREWLKSLSNSMYFVGATFGLLFWGIISDRYGRKTAYVCSHFVTLIFGFSALFADSMCTYILLRSINAFGMIGELIPRSIQVEMVATRYRYICSVICQIGWATGIISVPILSYINPGYRFILAFPVLVSALMLPWLIWLPESARWLITNNKYSRAKEELRRAAKINGKLSNDTDLLIERYNKQVLHEEVSIPIASKKRIGVWRSILAIFTNMHLLKDTMAVFALLFVAEVVYFSLTLNVADLGGSLYINYIISGLSELVSIACCALMLAFLSRRCCLSILLLASTVSYLLMSLVSLYEESLSMFIILGVNAFGKLTAIGNLMVIILVSQEVFPTVIRQFGTSLCITVGKAGSAVAPFTHELGQIIGQSYCFAMFSIICLICALIPFGLSETGNCELPDTVVDVEAIDSQKKRKKKDGLAQVNTDHKEEPDLFNGEHGLYQTNLNNETKPNDFSKVNGHQNGIVTKSGLDITKEPSTLLDQITQLKNGLIQDDPNNNSIHPSDIDHNSFLSKGISSFTSPNHRSMSNLSCDTISGTESNIGSSSDVSSNNLENKRQQGRP